MVDADATPARRVSGGNGVPAHLPSHDLIAGWPAFTPEQPLRLLVSGCLAGLPVGADGSSYGEHPEVRHLIDRPDVSAVAFCPEHFAFGTPRAMPDIHGGDGHDVLDGRARVLADSGEDWTDGMIAAARRMLQVAQDHDARLAVLMDISAACGSQVIYNGARTLGVYQAGQGVCAALLVRHGIAVVSQRDQRTLHAVLRKLDPALQPDPELRDHHEAAWYMATFPT